MYEPGCYDKPEYDKDKYKLSMASKSNIPPTAKLKDLSPAPDIETFNDVMTGIVNLAEVKEHNEDNAEKVNSGIPTLDKHMGGFEMGQTTVWTGSNAAGKSTVLGQVLAESIEHGYRVFAFSGELKASKFQFWADLQFAGSPFIEMRIKKETGKEYPFIDPEARKLIHSWYSGKYFIYDNRCGMKYGEILKAMQAAYDHLRCRVFLIDNIMRLDMQELSKDQYEAQSKFINDIADFAQLNNVHVHVVAHPRKVFGAIITKADVSGSGDLTNRADNVLGIHRTTAAYKTEFEKNYKHLPTDAKDKIRNSTNVIEIFKTRDAGVQDVFIPLKYCEGSKRIIDMVFPELEKKQYGWIPDSYEAPANECVQDDLLDWVKDDPDCPF